MELKNKKVLLIIFYMHGVILEKIAGLGSLLSLYRNTVSQKSGYNGTVYLTGTMEGFMQFERGFRNWRKNIN